jgi:predicted AAA+ superfamily ATPase
MPATEQLFPRHAQRSVSAALADTRVVVINGARQTGKSTLARLIAAAVPGSELCYLDEAPVRAAAQADPSLFVRHDGLLVIDEVQRAPDLFLAIKCEVDTDPRPGRFLLTGSARLLGLQEIRQPTAPVGPLMETFVLGELARQLASTDQPVRLHHYRDRDQYEVDAVLESASGEVVAYEVKAAETVRSEDFRGIQRLARRLGDQFVAGIVLYAGGQPLPFGDRLRAWPISALWTLAPDADGN